MVQRLSTPIAPSVALMALALGGRYSEQALKAGIDHHMGDLIFASLPQVPLRWVHGGNLHQSRHCSQLLSLQLKARLAGIPTPVDGQAAVHHTR